ncbi:type II secretory pathway component PulF [Arthrobacter woluwensis]|uniref:hypothetical protein n=1 Tax=Arthrobacter woluwensis TaxID=156980 RepID=UPI002782846F|nr:hypothetical protein [Arthrobacter woluwensis]MDQ0710093.1 type II secretory pathway component PulF [Arthrobacter woluwensis]
MSPQDERTPSRAVLRAVPWMGIVELCTLSVMLLNLLTLRDRLIPAVVGPLHGLTWVALVMVAALAGGLSRRDRVLLAIPAIGGLAAAARLAGRSRRKTGGEG